MITLITDPVPAWYEISFEKKLVRRGISYGVPAIILRIHPDILRQKFLAELAESLHMNTLMPLQALLPFTKARSWSTKSFLVSFQEIIIPLPRVRRLLEEPCSNCGGSGKDRFSRCNRCEGEGHEAVYEWDQAHLACKRLETVFICLGCNFDNLIVDNSHPQLLTVGTTYRCKNGLTLYPLGGIYSQALVRWLDSFPAGTGIEEAVTAMKITHYHMTGEKPLPPDLENGLNRFSARLVRRCDGNVLFLECPGNACDIEPMDDSRIGGYGYEWTCHNVDNPLQQLTLLAGLAALCDKARGEMKF